MIILMYFFENNDEQHELDIQEGKKFIKKNHIFVDEETN